MLRRYDLLTIPKAFLKNQTWDTIVIVELPNTFIVFRRVILSAEYFGTY